MRLVYSGGRPVGRAAPRAWRAPVAAPQAEARHVLVADGDPQAAHAIAVLLRHLGHGARVVYDGRAALEAARANPPQLLLLGLALPGIDAFRVLQRLRDEYFIAAPVVALSRSSRDDERQRLRDAGFDEQLVRPVHLKALRQLLKRL